MEIASFQFGNQIFFRLPRKSINYEKTYLNTLTTNFADRLSQTKKGQFPDENWLKELLTKSFPILATNYVL